MKLNGTIIKRQLKVIVVLLVILIVPFGWESLRTNTWHFTLVLAVFLGALWLLFRSQEGDHFRLPWVTLPLAGYVLWRALSLIFTPLPYYATFTVLSEILVLIMFVFIFDSFSNGWQAKFWENALIAICVVFVFADLIDLLKDQVAWWSISGNFFSTLPVTNRAQGALLGHPNFLAGYINLVIPLVIVRTIRATERRTIGTGLVVIFLLLLGQYLTYSRTGWLACIGSIAVTLLICYQARIRKKLFRSNISNRTLLKRNFVFLIAGILLSIPAIIFAITQTSSAGHGSVSMRLAIWSHSLKEFASSPLLGNGVRSLVVSLAGLENSIGVDEVSHAHNLYLQIGAESGIIGLGLLFISAYLIGRAYLGSWRTYPSHSSERAGLAAFAGATAGILIHGLGDFLFWRATFNIAFLVILALFYSIAPKKDILSVKRWVMIPIIAIFLLGLTVGRLITTRDLTKYAEAIDAAESDDWETAQRLICDSAASYPGATLYGFQCAQASSKIAYESGDDEMLQSALQSQTKSIAADPYWYMHWANLASYEWESGQIDQALEHMQKAVDMAPGQNILRLNLAWMQESAGYDIEAQKNYHRVFCQSPSVADSVFYQRTELRKGAISTLCKTGTGQATSSSSQSLIQEGRLALKAGQIELADQVFKKAIEIQPDNSSLYAYLALVYQTMDQEDATLQALRTAFYINPYDTNVLFNAARVAIDQGDQEAAQNFLSAAFELLSQGQYSHIYYANAYRLKPLPIDLSPYLIQSIPSTDEMILLESHYRYLDDTGLSEDAREIYKWIQQSHNW